MNLKLRKKKNKNDFRFFQESEPAKEFFSKIYACTIDDANAYILKNCLTESGLKACEQMNAEFYAYSKELLKERAKLPSKEFSAVQNCVERDGSLTSYGLWLRLSCLSSTRYYTYEMWSKNNKPIENCFKDLKALHTEYNKRKSFLEDCKRVLGSGTAPADDIAEPCLFGGIGASVAFVAVLIMELSRRKGVIDAKYSELYATQSATLKDEYAQSFSYSSSAEMEEYFNSFLIQVTKQDKLNSLNADLIADRNALANYFGVKDYEELQHLITESTKSISRNDYITLLSDKYNLNIALLAKDNGFSTVEEMDNYLRENVIRHSGKRYYQFPTWRKQPDYYEFKTTEAEQMFNTKNELKLNYNRERNNLPVKRGENIETVSNPTLSVANDRANALTDDYNNDLAIIQSDENFPRFEYSSDDILASVTSYHAFEDTLPQKVRSMASQQADFDFDIVAGVCIPAISFSCIAIGMKLAQIVALNNKRNDLVHAFDLNNNANCPNNPKADAKHSKKIADKDCGLEK